MRSTLMLFAVALAVAAADTPQDLQKKCAAQLGVPVEWTSPGGIGFVLIPPGEFMMGGNEADDAPAHRVSISEPFYLARTEMTQKQWRDLTGKVHSTVDEGPDRPINYVTYRQASEALKLLGKEVPGARLPTEAEWEFAARGGETSEPTEDQLDRMAWSAMNSNNATHPVGKKQPNAFGLQDMLGNTWEWCADYYDPDYYSRSPASDPKGARSGSFTAIAFSGEARHCSARKPAGLPIARFCRNQGAARTWACVRRFH